MHISVQTSLTCGLIIKAIFQTQKHFKLKYPGLLKSVYFILLFYVTKIASDLYFFWYFVGKSLSVHCIHLTNILISIYKMSFVIYTVLVYIILLFKCSTRSSSYYCMCVFSYVFFFDL